MHTPSHTNRYYVLTLALLVVGGAILAALLSSGSPVLASSSRSGSEQVDKLSAPQASGTPCGQGEGWNMVPAPDGGSYSNSLYGVASISSNDTWAVGEQYNYTYSSYVPMIEHWNGSEWSVIQASLNGVSLRGVAAISSNDVWAVGWMGGYSSSPLTEHWNGSQWTYVPANASGGRKLYSVSAVSANDVWAVGQSSTGVLIFHWNGTQWTPSPAPTITAGVLNGVTAISANDVWAVGTSNNAETITLHWDGTQWSRISSPNSGAFINVLTAVTSISSNNIWAVGYWATSGVAYHGYTLHWDGSQWSASPNPTGASNPTGRPEDPAPAGTYLYAVSAASNGEVWAVGRNLQTASTTSVTIHLDGNGGNWTEVSSPNPGYANTNLYGVSISGITAWAVGKYDTGSLGYTVPSTQRNTPSTCPTPTPGTPTNTRTPVPTSAVTNTAVRTSTPTPCGNGSGWNVVAAPDGGSYSNGLYGVASISTNDVWAVGEQYDSGLSSYTGMIEHWNGTAWSVVPSSRYGISVRGVAAISPSDVWAVGWGGGYGFSPFTEHWDGTQWNYVPANASGGRKLYAVSAVSTNDVWAVGQSTNGVLIFHWNGTQWTPSSVPSIPSGVLNGVTAISANDAWALGTSNNAETVTLHWDGSLWSRIASPNDGAFINVLTATSAAASDDVWAVGYWATSGVDYHGYSLHWDGSQWASITNPTSGDDPVRTGTYLYGVSATPNGNVWMVGRNLQNNGSTGVAMRFDGDSWTLTPSPNLGYANTDLYAVATTNNPDDVWGVGNYDTSSYGYTYPLTEHYGGPCATPTPLPATPTATPTACTSGPQYLVTRTTGATIVPGIDSVGIDCQFNCTANINLPFPFTLYDRTFTTAIVGSNGVLGFVSNTNSMQPSCLPSTDFNYAIAGDWETLVYRYSVEGAGGGKDQPGTNGAGVFTSVTGVAPDRIFNIEWRARDQFNVSPVNFEIRLYENSDQGRFDIVYAAVNHHGGHASVGVQMDTGSRWTQFSCLTQGRIERWNGTAWSVVPSSRYGISVRGVAAISPSDVWAVGWGGGYGFSPFTEHWDGTQWNYVPANASGGRKLYAVSAVSTNDVWAVGQSTNGVLIFHWNGTQWTPSSVPSIPSGVLNGVTAISANDAWALGTSNNAETVTLHWDGSLWSRIASPNDGAFINVLTATSAAASDDVWAVGYWATSGVDYHGYSLHWDGSQWASITNPTSGDDPVRTGTYLYGVSATPNGNVWMVGRNLQNNGSTGVAMRFDGDSWTLTPSPNLGYANTDLYAVATTNNPDDVWGVGNYDTSSYGYTYPLTEHYGGPCATPTPLPATPTATPTACTSGPQYLVTRTTGATIVPGIDSVGIDCQFNCTANINLPFPFTLYDRTFTTAIVGSNGVLGFVSNTNSMQPSCLPSTDFNYAIAGDWETLVYRYSVEGAGGGKDQPGTNGAGVFTSVTGVAPDRIFNIEWRARDQFNVSPVNFEIRLYENSDQGRFDIVYAAVNHHGGHASVGVQMDTGSRWTQFSCLTQGRIEREVQLTFVRESCGSSSTPTAVTTAVTSPIATNTPVSGNTNTPVAPTSTQVAATNTQIVATGTAVEVTSTAVASTSTPIETAVQATSTPGECHITFSDVLPDSPFYSQISCLVCRGVMSGYSDNTFRPDTEITRGQLSKIVSNSAGFDDVVTEATFEDVPLDSTFYIYIERMVGRDVISGYPCGAEGEPCGIGNKPYFRPFATATRGQIAKIVSNAGGYNNIPTDQMFEDVPSGNVFYLYIERLGSRNIMAGYSCGGPGEPCGQGNRPYFRLYNNATRGQTAKIVANTFFPNCTGTRP